MDFCCGVGVEVSVLTQVNEKLLTCNSGQFERKNAFLFAAFNVWKRIRELKFNTIKRPLLFIQNIGLVLLFSVDARFLHLGPLRDGI
jgi:hypothetical protein